jgi:exodeoxyribonuclease VII small subunit
MESGEAPLDSLVKNYQNGLKMLNFCRGKIEAAEMKIKEVQEKNGGLIEKDFDDLA